MPQPIRRYGLIGFPLGHSYSRGHFQNKFLQEGLTHCIYENFEINDAAQFLEIIHSHQDLAGLNVTIPHKQTIIPYLDSLDSVALEIGAVNTIKIDRSASAIHTKGFNTDVTGFMQSLAKWSLPGKVKALIFGTGGSSLAVKFALSKLGIEHHSVSRFPADNAFSYEELTEEIASENKLWINCTPVGMFPEVNRILPLPYQSLSRSHYLFDLIYNPDITGFLQRGTEAGASVMNGRIMLYEQAEAAWKIWNS